MHHGDITAKHDMFRIRYEGRADHEGVIGVSTTFSLSLDEALESTRKWVHAVFGDSAVFEYQEVRETFSKQNNP